MIVLFASFSGHRASCHLRYFWVSGRIVWKGVTLAMTLMRDWCDGASCPFDYKREMKSLAHAIAGSGCQCFDGCQYIGPCFCFA